MRRPRKAALRGAMVLGAAAMLSQPALAQDFPTKRITIVVPFAPGGVIDLMGRSVGEDLQKRWGQPVVVDNRPGGAGAIGAQVVMRADPDGHTLMAATAAQVSTPVFVKNPGYFLDRDLAPVAGMFYAPYVIITNPQVPARTLREFIAYAKANPGKLNFAATSTSSQLLDTLDFVNRVGIKMTPVPYKSGTDSLRSVMANETQAYFGAILGLEDQVKSGRITALAVTTAKPSARLPDVPTVKAVTGIDFDASVLYAMYTTLGTPRTVIAKLHSVIADIVTRSEFSTKMKSQGYEPMPTTPDELATYMARESRRAIETAQKAGIQPE